MSEVMTLVEQERRQRVRWFRRSHKINKQQLKTMQAGGFHICDVDNNPEDFVVWHRGDLKIEIHYRDGVTTKKLVQLVAWHTRCWVVKQMHDITPEEMKL